MAERDFLFNPKTRLYESVDGSVVSAKELRRVVTQFLDNAIVSADDIVDGLREERNVAGFELAMRDLIKKTHGAAGAIAQGGYKQMRPSDWGKIGNTVRREYEYLAEWGREIEELFLKGEEPNYNKLRGYMRMYVRDAFSTFANMLRNLEAESGEFPYEQRHLNPGAKHCQPCKGYAALKRVPIGTLPDIGEECDCFANCQCYFTHHKTLKG